MMCNSYQSSEPDTHLFTYFYDQVTGIVYIYW